MLPKLIALLLVFPGTLLAGPFLICDPYPESLGVNRFIIDMDGQTQPAGIETLPDNSVRLLHDLSNIDSSKHVVSIQACNEMECSEWSEPFEFDLMKPFAPGFLRVM